MSRKPPRFLLVLLVAASAAFAHPLGNFTIAHYSRIRVTPDAVLLRYVIDMAEIPAFQEMPHLDADQDRVVSPAEKRSYLRRKVPDLASLLAVHLNGRPLSLRIESSDLTTAPGEMGLPTMRIVADFRAQLPRGRLQENTVLYEDRYWAQRAGWKEIVVNAEGAVKILKSSAPRTDRSAELTRYPTDATVVPPQDMSAEFRFAPAPGGDFRAATRLDRWIDSVVGTMLVAGLFLLLARKTRSFTGIRISVAERYSGRLRRACPTSCKAR